MKNSTKGFAPIVIILGVVVVLALAGGGYYYLKPQQSIHQPQTQLNASLLSEEESLNIAEQAVVKDLKTSVKTSCLIFADKKEANFIIYTVTRKFNNNCPGDPTSTPAIPQLKIDRLSRSVFVQSLDDEFRPLSPSQQATSDETANWKTYRNDQYGFELKYPDNWSVTKRGLGEAIPATGNESSFSIGNNLESKGIGFIIAKLGSAELGSFYDSAKTLEDYTNLLAKKDSNGNIIRKLNKEITIDGRKALWFDTYQWEVDLQAYSWTPQIYFQDQDNIYEINPSGSVALNLLDEILSTFRFKK